MFRPYPDYRRTDLKWFEYLPESWAILRTKQMFRLVIEKAPANNQMELLSVYTHIGVRPRKSLEQRGNKASTTDGYWVVKEGDIICNKLLAWMGAIGASHYQGVTSPAYDILRPIKPCNTDYYHFLFRTKKYLQQFKIRSRGIMDMRLRLYFDQFGQIPIPVPPRREQDQIVAYLRVQDGHIARFIKAKRDLISLLIEQKQTIIEGAVTQGLNAATEKRDSGIDWIPNIPAHWETCKLKHVAAFNPSRSESATFRLSDVSVSFLPMECITTDGKLQSVENRKTSEVWEGYTYFRRNDVVMAKITPCFENGKGGLLDTLPTEIGFGTTEFIVLRAAEQRIRPAFLAKLLSLRTFRVLGADAMTGAAGQQRVPLGFVKNFGIALPPLDEQDQILNELQTATAEQDVAIEKIRSEIALIREYRDRLIADVVTGQVDVRGWQPGPEDVVDDAALASLGDEQEDVTEEEDGNGEE